MTAPRMEDHAFDLGGAEALATPEGGLFFVEESALVVSDLHLEKGSSFAEKGVMLPPYDTAATLARLIRLVDRLRPRRLVALGDSFHDRRAGPRVSARDREALAALEAVTECVWVEGNHDPEAPAWLSGARAETLRIGACLLRHEPGGPLDEGASVEIAGHLHPVAKVAGAAGRRVRRRCLATDGTRVVMPAFGAYAGGLNVLDRAFAPVFPGPFRAYALGSGKVHAIASARLEPDAGRLRA